ncbi:putative chlorophyll(ide) b reductase nyc1, chloroplastic [Asimina triloba]
MAAVSKLHLSPNHVYLLTFKDPPRFRPTLGRNPASCYGLSFPRQLTYSRRPCRSFKSEDRGESTEVRSRDNERWKSATADPSPAKERKGALHRLKSLLVGVSGSASASGSECQSFAAKAEEIFFSVVTHVGRYLITMMSTGVILAIGFQMSGGDSQMNTLIWYSWLGGIIIGTMIGANMVLEEHCKAGPRNVVITGSTRGLGKALAREFLLSGDRVVVASRSTHTCVTNLWLYVLLGFPEGSPESVHETVLELEENLKEGRLAADGSPRKNMTHAKVVGIPCDVCRPDDVRMLAEFAANEVGSIDIWINNAGTNKGFRPLLQFSDEDINQEKGGHVFNMDGAGSGGSSTPLTAVYGSTKCGLRQLQASLLSENKRSKVGIHTASPGMVLTDLLLSGSTLKNKQMFNIICELPETVARTLVPRMRVVKGSGKAINYLTPPRILLALVTAWLRRGRWFDDQGRALYAAEADRIRNWAESRTRFSFTDAMEMYTERTWVSVFSLSVEPDFCLTSIHIITKHHQGTLMPACLPALTSQSDKSLERPIVEKSKQTPSIVVALPSVYCSLIFTNPSFFIGKQLEIERESCKTTL